MLTELEKQTRAVQSALNTLEKTLKSPTTAIVKKNQFKRTFEALREHFHGYEKAYFGSKPANEELVAIHAMSEDLNEKFYEIGCRVDDLIEPPPTKPASPTRPSLKH